MNFKVYQNREDVGITLEYIVREFDRLVSEKKI